MKIIVICLLVVLYSCSDELTIKQDYDYSIQTLPVPQKIQKGQTVPIEFMIIRDAVYKKAVYSFRFFQTDGKGTLTNDKGQPYTVNRYYIIEDTFTLLYTSRCEEAQTLDFVFTDNFGKESEYRISFQYDGKKD
ncbi:TraQ conjugal transfer family protein [Culturomica massiliensis]|uniref:TraQ conjugal transfer family protein n=1 Tax=Culturomica massiliensis TaxID=1841857 RepID=UPI0026667526|nr:TraQ conjugal transfer family protein [Culturomica massiliensis]